MFDGILKKIKEINETIEEEEKKKAEEKAKSLKIKLDEDKMLQPEKDYQKIRPRRNECAKFGNTFVRLTRLQQWKAYVHKEGYLITLNEGLAIIVTYDILNYFFCDCSKSFWWE